MRWSRPCWNFMHRAFLYKPDFHRAKQYLESLQGMIPCAHCRNHYKNYLEKNPVTQATDLFSWSVDLHNDVNKRTKKPTMTVEKARKIYAEEENKPVRKTAPVLIIMGIVFSLIILIVLFAMVKTA